MKLITVEEHYLSLKVNEVYTEVMNRTASPEQVAKSKFIADYLAQGGGGLTEIGPERIAYMDQVGVDVQLISYGNNNPQDLPAEYAIPMTRLANNEMATKIAGYPERFYGLASLPVADVPAAVAELRRAVTELGFKGAQLTGTFEGRFFDEEEFLPIFEEAARLDVPIALHPGEVAPAVIQHYYEGDWSDQVTNVLAGHGFGWHADIGIEVMRLIVSGIFDKLPNLKIISGHFGELIPYYLDRLDETLPTTLTGLTHTFADYYREHIYVSPSGMFYDAPFDLCLKVLKPDHLLWSMDYPYMKRENTRSYLEDFQLSDNQRAAIAHLNAEKLLKL